MAGLLDVFLDVDGAVAERLLRLAARDVVFLGEGNVVVRDAHAAPAAAGDGLDDHRVTDLAGDFHRLGLGFDRAIGTGDDGHTGLAHSVLGDGFVAHHLDGFRLRTDELDVTGFALLGELGVLGKETVTWMNGVNVRDLGGANDAIGAEIAVGALVAANADRLVGKLHVE